ncbi:hypothetical protein [Pedobacter hiemivivus]|uniref:DUF3990 domain-containing protein n=1 Tax=Pedobacter hiemivivus TaxID=2530454 RepID=A0A4R0N4V8_9SPHI|nr:hypothetical protein [Pedobacter hiemivivus]TCC94979.1 hypothetical protein EZ444_15830 [Pedobacter hiemivivus]
MMPILYHGSPGIMGDTINLKPNTGVGWNAFTLGNGFYTSVNEGAARLFSHIAMQTHLLRQGQEPGKITIGKIYQIHLKDEVNLLDAQMPLDPRQIREILLLSGIRENAIAKHSDSNLSKMAPVINILAYGENYNCNPYEHLVRCLGFDGLKILEKSWDNWDYYPRNIGVDWEQFYQNYKFDPPDTVVIYDTGKIKSFEQLYGAERLHEHSNKENLTPRR